MHSGRTALRLLPSFLQLEGLDCLVVGAGKVATNRIRKLVEAGGSVTVISPEVGSEVSELVQAGHVTWLARCYESGDVEPYMLIVGATNQRAVNAQIVTEAKLARRFVNVIDSPQDCSFVFPASVQAESIQVAISTSGTDPGLSKRLRQSLEADIEQGTNHFTQMLHRRFRHRDDSDPK